MTVAFEEAADSRQVTTSLGGQGVRLKWFGFGSTDEAEVVTALLLLAPTTWDGLVFVGHAANPLPGAGIWECAADYAFSAEQSLGALALAEPGLDDPLGPEVEFDLTAATAHIAQSLYTVWSRMGAPAWVAATAYRAGDRVTNDASPSVRDGRVYKCTTGGTSAGSGGPTGTGTAIDDNGVKWDYVFTVYPAWEAEHVYEVDQRVTSGGGIYTCATGGTSTTAAAGGPSGDGDGIVDGTAVWDFLGFDLDSGTPDYHNAIGVTRDRVNGCDVFAGHLEFGVTAQVYPGTLTLILALLRMVATVNNARWWGFPAGSLLYLGATGQCKPGQVWTLKHRFACSPNLTDVQVGPDILLAAKRGWDFLWATYTDRKLGDFLVQVPNAAYVEQVYRYTDYSTLPI